MKLDISITDDDIERIATRTSQLLAEQDSSWRERWCDVAGAAEYLALTEDAVRGLVKRGQLSVYRTENRRLRFALADLDRWVRSGSCEPDGEDL